MIIKTKSFLIACTCAALILLLATLSFAEERSSYNFAADVNYPPYSFIERTTAYTDTYTVRSEKYSGFAIELLQLLSQKINEQIHLRLSSPEEVPSKIDQGELDGFIGTSPKLAVGQNLLLSKPILVLEFYIFTLEGQNYANLEALEGSRTAIYAQSPAITDLKKYENIDVYKSDSVLDALKKLDKREVAAVVAERSVASFYLQQGKFDNIQESSVGHIAIYPYYIAVSPENENLHKKIDQGLLILEHEQTIDHLKQKWLGHDTQRPLPWGLIILMTTVLSILMLAILGILWVISLNATVERKTRQIKQLNDQLKEKAKLAVIGKLAGQIAHELRTPLSIMHNTIYLLKREGHENEDNYQKRLQLLENKIKLSSDILESILSYSRVKAEAPSTISVNKCIRTVMKDIEMPEDIEKVVDLRTGEDITIYMDFHQLYSVIRNLVMNAIQAMGEKGKLKVESYLSDEERTINIRVTDTGGGIPEPLREKIFELFYSSKTTGTGLGLPISKSIVKTHKGDLYVERSDNTGSSLVIELPRGEKQDEKQ